MRPEKVLDYENPRTREARRFPTGPPPSGPLLYRSGLVFGAIFAWWALSTAVDVSDPFIAKGGDVNPAYFFDHYVIFLPLVALLAFIAFELCRHITQYDSPGHGRARLEGPIVMALLLPSIYFAFAGGGMALTGDVRFPYQITPLQIACFSIGSLTAVVAAGFRLRTSKRLEGCWLGAGWAAPCVLVSNFEGFKYFGQYVTGSPGGINEYSIGGFLYWTLALISGLVAVPLFAALFLEAPQKMAISSVDKIEADLPPK
jgi:hypothetical protein